MGRVIAPSVRRRWTSVALAAGLTLGIAPSASAAFCEKGQFRDDLAPLASLPPVKAMPPTTNLLPFGPHGLVLNRLSEVQTTKPLVVAGTLSPEAQTLGYEFRNDDFERPRRVKLNWIVTARLVKLESKRTILSRTTRRIGVFLKKKPRRFTFSTPTAAGIYLLEIEFRKKTGRVGRVGSYFRVMPAVTNPVLSLSATTLGPGDRLEACLKNDGTLPLELRASTIERFNGSAWEKSSIYNTAPTAPVALLLPAGWRTPVESFTMPADVEEGLYRYAWHGAGNGVPTEATAEFHVLSPAP
jgi:hypothetical protein